jgi:hypothetical protein
LNGGAIHHRMSVFAGLLLVSVISLSFSQNHILIIQDGAAFNGIGSVTVKDSIRNSSSSAPLNIPGKTILSGTAQVVAANGSNGSLQFEILSVRGSGNKTMIGTIGVTDSLHVLSSAVMNVSNDTLRIGSIAANEGTILTNTSSVIEYTQTNSPVQSVAGGVYNGKIRLINGSRKTIPQALTIDSLEHSGWGLLIDNNVTVSGKTQIDSLIQVASGMTLSLGVVNSTIATLQGNVGLIQANSTGTLTFINNAVNGNGTIRTDNSLIAFQGNVSSTGTLAVTGTGTMTFGGTVTSANYSFTNGSTEIYNGGVQAIALANYGNLTLRNAGIKTFSTGSTGIGGTLALLDGAIADAVTNSATINYNGTGTQTVGAIDYYNLALSDHGTQQITLSNGSVIRVAGALTNSINNTNIVNTNNTFEYNGTTAQTVIPFPYFNLTLSGSGTKTVSVSQTANGDVLQLLGTALTVDGSVVWQIDGSLTTQVNFINNGDITIGN